MTSLVSLQIDEVFNNIESRSPASVLIHHSLFLRQIDSAITKYVFGTTDLTKLAQGKPEKEAIKKFQKQEFLRAALTDFLSQSAKDSTEATVSSHRCRYFDFPLTYLVLHTGHLQYEIVFQASPHTAECSLTRSSFCVCSFAASLRTGPIDSRFLPTPEEVTRLNKMTKRFADNEEKDGLEAVDDIGPQVDGLSTQPTQPIRLPSRNESRGPRSRSHRK